MAITTKLIKELREKTGVGMMDCKKALVETDGDIEKAIVYLREKGLAAASKKAGRIAAEGAVKVVVKDDKVAGIVEVNSETDFVAKNEDFQNFVEDVAEQVLVSDAKDLDAFLAESWAKEAGKTVKEVLNEKIAVIGENLNIRRFEKIVSEGCVAAYIHGNGKIGAVVEADCNEVNDAVKTCLRNVAMQVAAMNPKYVSREEVPSDYIESEKEILLHQAKTEHPEKPDNIIEKMITGRLNKELKEVCLLDQSYVQDPDLTVEKYIAQAGANIKINKIVRFETGEGLEKKEENFAEEIQKQLNA
ncbi:translation elongation factor Ts [Anaerofustis stercorihominis]|uniref:translation elongation factor Ts n=1 Tax=Anaerofustis stercorihominis TaxID=214853 RepID=UPI001105A34C|nr:translation elongation factor Ts [Anaerofustis stercorihominis]